MYTVYFLMNNLQKKTFHGCIPISSTSQSQVKEWTIQTVETRAAVGVKRPMFVKNVVLSSLSGLIFANI